MSTGGPNSMMWYSHGDGSNEGLGARLPAKEVSTALTTNRLLTSC